MKNYRKRAMQLNPIVLLIYWMFCSYIMGLAEYGGVARRLPIIGLSGVLLLLWIYMVITDKVPKLSKGLFVKLARPWYYLAVIILVAISYFTAYDVYQSSIPFQGKLSWVINDFKKTRKMKFEHDNVYEEGIEGILQDIESRVSLPDELFISNEFSLSFNEEGEITSIYSSMYGENDSGELESFLVSYDEEKDHRISVNMGPGDSTMDFDEEMRLQPLIDFINLVSLENVIADWSSDSFEVYYIGERNWGYNTEGIIYYNEDGVLGEPESAYREIEGYTSSIHLGHDSDVTPKRFVYTEAESLEEAEGSPGDEPTHGERPNEVDEEFELNEDVSYRLEVMDAALGSRFYGLSKRSEADGEYEMINPDPFNGSSGGAAGLTFIDEDLGFTALAHSGGTYADLYRTTDGGESFELIEIPEEKVSLNETEEYNPFVYPEMPFEEEDYLIMYVNQGAEGDYKRGVRAIYHSYDDGLTWEFIEEEEMEKLE